ncbi:MAG: PD-(D/E)XK nuclease family protein, partial [Oscillospiraceae bacterium]
ITPILKFKKSEINLKDGKQLAAKVFEYILESGAKQRLEGLSTASAQKTAEGTAMWEQFVFLLDKFVDFCERFSVSSYKLNLTLLNMFFEDAGFEFAQQGLDQVLVSSAEKARPFNPKAVFIVGANSCNFPKFEEQNDIFNWAEQNKFKNLAFNRLFNVCSSKNNDFADPKANIANDEKLIFYNSITAARDMVFVSFVKNSITGAKLNPSVFVEKLQGMFEGLKYQEAEALIKDEDLICNKQTAMEALGECYGTNIELESALLELLATDENFGQINSRLTLKHVPNAQRFKIAESELLRELKSKKWKISPTDLENFTICRFKYFCRDVLNLNIEKELKIQKKDIGSILHFVIYFVFKKYYKNNINLTGKIDFLDLFNAKKHLIFDSEKTEEFEKLVKLAINNYFKNTIGRLFNKTAHEEYISAQIENIALTVLYNVVEELKHSDFLPCVFEAKSNEDYKYKDFDITLEGKIDRVDLLQINKELWVRVIDYKSGKKRFGLVDIYNGLYYQVLFYMKLLLNLKTQVNMLPAGALYMPIKNELLAQEVGEFAEAEQIFKAPKMYGVVIDNQEILKHMEENLSGKIIPAALNKSGEFKSSSSVFTIKQFNLVFNYIEKLIKKHFDFIEDGDFKPIPLKFNDYDVCKTCEYRSICGFEEDDEKRVKEYISEEEFWSALMVE